MHKTMNKFPHFYALFASAFLLSILIIFQISFITDFLELEVLSIPIAIVSGLYIARKQLTLPNILILISILIVSALYSYYLFDKAGDGRWYHQETMILLKDLWNPLRNYSNLRADDSFIFSKSYPIANETFATGLYLLTNSIQIGKSINTLFAFYTMSIGYIFLQEFNLLKQKKDAIIVSLLIAFNPIVCSQLFSYYLDGNLFCCFVVALLSSYAYLYTDNKNKNFWLITLCCSFWILSNIKATGLIYAISIISIINLFGYFKNKSYFNYNLLITLILGECLLGWHPYIQNLIAGHNIFWPVMGKDSIDILTMLDVSPYPKILFPLLSYLIPYPINFDILTWAPDIKTYIRTDARFGACGPFFGLLLLGLSSALCTGNLKSKILQFKELTYTILALSSIIIITIFINPKWWFAKYVPQIYLLPLFALVLLINYKPKQWAKYKKIILLLFIINSLLFLSGSLILTGYRSILFFNMENVCKNEPCILSGQNNTFKRSLTQQLNDDKVIFINGTCNPKNIIWEDSKINGTPTNIICQNK